jgi:hypothetical protein
MKRGKHDTTLRRQQRCSVCRCSRGGHPRRTCTVSDSARHKEDKVFGRLRYLLRHEDSMDQQRCTDTCPTQKNIGQQRPGVMPSEEGGMAPNEKSCGLLTGALDEKLRICRERRSRVARECVARNAFGCVRAREPNRFDGVHNSYDRIDESECAKGRGATDNRYRRSRSHGPSTGVQEALLRWERCGMTGCICSKAPLPVGGGLSLAHRRFIPSLQPSRGVGNGKTFSDAHRRAIEPPGNAVPLGMRMSVFSTGKLWRRGRLRSDGEGSWFASDIFKLGAAKHSRGSMRQAMHDRGALVPRTDQLVAQRGRQEVVHRGCITYGQQILRRWELRTTHGGGVPVDIATVRRFSTCGPRGANTRRLVRELVWRTEAESPWWRKSKSCSSQSDGGTGDGQTWSRLEPPSARADSWRAAPSTLYSNTSEGPEWRQDVDKESVL